MGSIGLSRIFHSSAFCIVMRLPFQAQVRVLAPQKRLSLAERDRLVHPPHHDILSYFKNDFFSGLRCIE